MNAWKTAVTSSTACGFLLAAWLGSFAIAASAATYPASQVVTGQPPVITLARPAYLQPTAIPGLGTSILRISDAATFGSGQRYYRHYYAKQQPWNSDGTKIILSHDSSRVYFLDGKTFAYQFTRTNVPEYPKWSNSNPDLMFAVSGVTFVKYFVSTGVKQTLKSFPEFSSMWLGVGEGNLSNDDRYAPLIGVNTSGGRTVVIYDTLNNAEVSRKDFGSNMDWTSMSPSGQYVVVNGFDAVAGKVVYNVYDRQMNFLRTLNAYAGGHADLGYDSTGNEVLVGALDGLTTAFWTVRLSDNTLLKVLPATHMTWNWHVSCRNINRPGYCYVSGFAFGSGQTAYLYREVFAVKLDGSNTVERFSQDFKASLPLTDLAYSRSAMAVPNRDGSLVLFSSDWGDATSNAIIYDYVAGVQLTPVPSAATYYVATNGLDANPGTLSQPFATLNKAVTLVNPGDSIYLRGGTYHFTAQVWIDRSGSSGKYIHVLNYPGEVPIIDGRSLPSTSPYHADITLRANTGWWHFKGLEVSYGPAHGFLLVGSSNNIIEQCVIHHNTRLQLSGGGIMLDGGSSNNLILNNDSHHNGVYGSSGGDGIGVTGLPATGNIVRGNRVWRNNDDGIDLWDAKGVLVENNWSWENGYKDDLTPSGGNGVGFKLGGADPGDGNHTIRNNLAWRNIANGFDANSADLPMNVYNNTSYANSASNYHFNNGTIAYVLKNNLSLSPGGISIGSSTQATFNSWNLPVTVTSADFASIDFSGVTGARQSDGSLPASNFLKLVTGSDLIDKGTNVGIAFTGSAPDLGAYEFVVNPLPNQAPVIQSAPWASPNPVTLPATTTVSVAASDPDNGPAALVFTWSKVSGLGTVTFAPNGTATSESSTASFSAAGTYALRVTVSDGAASVIGDVPITVNAASVPPSITTQPASRTVTAGQTAAFSVAATGTAPLAYQWRKNAVNIAGATSASYTTAATMTSDNGALFSVVVSNSAGSVTSNNATLTVLVPPSITTQPASRTVAAGQTATFSVAATGTAPLAYQWRKNAVNIAGATAASYTTAVTATADSGAVFSVVVSNAAGSATSNGATLTVIQTLHVSSITMWLTAPNSYRTRAKAQVFVVDQSGAPKAGTSVTGTWSGLAGNSASGITGADGSVTLTSDRVRGSGTFTITVTGISMSGYTYDPAENVETSDSIVK